MLCTGADGGVYAVYCVSVHMRSGLRWVIPKRFSQFSLLRRNLREALLGDKLLLANFAFPPKAWFWNLSDAVLKYRQETLERFLQGLCKIDPQPGELLSFLQVWNNVTLSLSRHSTDAGSSALRLRALRSSSFGGSTQAPSVNDFKVIRVVGQGSFGKVFLVRPSLAPPSEVYAMKVLRKTEVVKRHQVEHTKTERKILASVAHPFILSLRFAFQTQDKLYMLTDFCPGGELFFHLKKLKSFSESMMRFYAAQIALALDYLLKNGVIYRDLKPENVLLDRDGNCKLTDFGLSKIVGGGHGSRGQASFFSSFSEESSLDDKLGDKAGATVANTFCGTPEYLSPEMLLHRQRGTGYGFEIDWWALGVVCFELLTGWPPFFDRDFGRMCEKILSRPVRFPSKFKLTPAGQAFVKGLLHREPSRRLGGGKAGFSAIQGHAFFSGMNWDAIERGLVIPPFVPSQDDSRNFERDLGKMPIAESPVPGSRILGEAVGSSGRGLPDNSGQQIIVPASLFADFEYLQDSVEIEDGFGDINGLEGTW